MGNYHFSGLDCFLFFFKTQSVPASLGQGRQTCAEEGALRPRPSILPVQLPEASNLSVPDLARTERKGVKQLTGRAFFPVLQG